MKELSIKFSLLLLFFSPTVWSCDLCAIYIANQAVGQTGTGFDVGVAESFTRFDTLKQDGHEIPNSLKQYLNSSTTQIFFSYRPIERLGLQVNLPLIYRKFRRAEAGRAENGSENGIGDISFTGNFLVLRSNTSNTNLDIYFLGGIKLPTGSSDRINEELSEEEGGTESESGIHGHDLTLGSGSVDGVIGASINATYKRLMLGSALQYYIRSRGHADYRFANDLQWNISPGGYLLLGHQYSFALQARVSGEYKRTDDLAGETADDTGITALYLGPNASLTWQSSWNVNVGLDLPMIIRNTALQIVPDYRLRASVAYRF